MDPQQGADQSSRAASENLARRWPHARQDAAAALGVGLFCYVGQLISITLRFPTVPYSPIWLPGGGILAAALIVPPRRRPFVMLGAYSGIFAALVGLGKLPVPLGLVSLPFTILGYWVLAAALDRVLPLKLQFDNLREVSWFILLAGLVIPGAGAGLHAMLAKAFGWQPDPWSVWRSVMLGQALGHLTVTPALLSLVNTKAEPRGGRPTHRWIEAGVLTLGLLGIGLADFMNTRGQGTVPALLYAPLPFLLWAALRFGPGGTGGALLFLALASSWSATRGYGTFALEQPRESQLEIQLFLAAIVTPVLFLSVMMLERQKTILALRRSEELARGQLAQLTSLYRTAPVSLASLDTQLHYVSISDQMAELRGLPPEAHLGRSLRSMLPSLANELEPIFGSVLQSGTPALDREFHAALPTRPGVERDWLVSGHPVKDERDGVLGVSIVFQDITERKRTEQALRDIAERVSAATGATFFRTLVRHLCAALSADYAFVGQLVGDRLDSVQTIAGWADGAAVPDVEYALPGTPCELVISCGLQCFPSGLQEVFPQDTMLQEMGVHSYLGVPLRDSTGWPLGLLSVLSRRPMTDVETAVATLEIFAARASAELEREQAEDQNRRLLHDLGERVKELTALHGAARIFQNDGLSTWDWLQQVLSLLPPAWQYPSVTAARIRVGEIELATPGFAITPWLLRAEFTLAAGHPGVVEVVYLEERPIEKEGPFLAEERSLIDSLAEMLRSALDRRQTEDALFENETALRLSYHQIQNLAGKLISAQDAERARIARELHDSINQQLAAFSISLSHIKRRLAPDATELFDSLAQLQEQLLDLADEVRHLSHELHPGVLRHAGLVAALNSRCAEFSAQQNIPVRFGADEGIDRVPTEVSLCLYRVTQEALQNVAKHSGANEACVTLSGSPAGLELSILDDGVGFDVPEARKIGGLGLLSLEERVRQVQGTLRIESSPKNGTVLRVRVPWGGNEHATDESASGRRPHDRGTGPRELAEG